MKPRLTHVALGVQDVGRSVAFYERHVRLQVVHERVEEGSRVVWLAEHPTAPHFVLVLFPLGKPLGSGPTSLHHFGFALESREEVDAAAALARADDVLDLEPADMGPIVGYFCIARDPDGNRIEFSFGQPIDPGALPAA